MMKRWCAVVGIQVLFSAACSRSSEDPMTVARAFWEATRAGDIELAKTYAIESASTKLT